MAVEGVPRNTIDAFVSRAHDGPGLRFAHTDKCEPIALLPVEPLAIPDPRLKSYEIFKSKGLLPEAALRKKMDLDGIPASVGD